MRRLLAWLAASLAVAAGCASGSHLGASGDAGSGTGGTLTGTGTGGTGTGGSGTGGTSTSNASGTGGMVMPGLGLGDDCTKDAECTSKLCKPVVIGSSSVCVTECTKQADCGASDAFFCEPITPNSPDGYCIPHSPAHCLSCKTDADCGSLSETCFQAPGDNAPACHVDCSIAGQSACPSDYACTDQSVNNNARKLCRPLSVPTCLDAIGGYCDRLKTPQPCTRTNPAGACLGQRQCLPGPKRFDKCDAIAPQCKMDCALQDPAGCMVSFCPAAISGVGNCGKCGNVCPGLLKPNDLVTCDGAMKCTFSCLGESYDVDGNPDNGCEVTDSPQGNHVKGNSADLGSLSGCDGNNNTQLVFGGKLPSDKRVHESPNVVGFDAASGSAPDFHKIFAVGKTFCTNDLVMQMCVTGSAAPACYKLTVQSDKATYSCQTNASGCCPDAGCGNMGICHNSGGQYSDDTDVYFTIQKTCSIASVENVTWTVNGHL
jgi:hypothetical protein